MGSCEVERQVECSIEENCFKQRLLRRREIEEGS